MGFEYTLEGLSTDAIGTLEYDLKREMAKEMTAIQHRRAIGKDPNSGTLHSYKAHAEALRAILEARTRQGYQPLHEMHVWPDDVYEGNRWDGGSRTILEIVADVHETGSPAEVRG